jgi:hypothetical protein
VRSRRTRISNKKEITNMALITVQGRFSKNPVAATSKNSYAFAAASLAENSKKNAATGLRNVTWYDVAAWSPEAIAQMTAVSPKDYVRVIGYPKDKGYPNLRIDNNDRAGVLENVVEFNTYAFAIVRGPDGRTMIRVPTTSTPELLRRIGTEVDLTGKQTDQENKRTRRTISLGRTR